MRLNDLYEALLSHAGHELTVEALGIDSSVVALGESEEYRASMPHLRHGDPRQQHGRPG
jgi:hypothetical protein